MWSTLITNPRKIMQNTFFLHFPFYFFILKKITKATYHEMHECYAMQILKTKKTKQQRRMVIKNREMKHKDHVRKTQLD